MNWLALIGLTIFIGTLSGKVLTRFRIPQVTGYLIAGVILGQSGIDLWTPEKVKQFGPLVDLALGIIGFLIGAELKADLFRHRGRSIYAILFSEGMMAFFVVGAAVYWFTGKFYLGLLFGALASATAPAATVDVLWEYKTRGPLTSTLLAIVALDDVLALLIYAVAGMFARSLIAHAGFSLHQVLHMVGGIAEALAVGLIGGLALNGLMHFIKDRERILPFSIAVVALTVGVASMLKTDLILSSMLMGVTLANLSPRDSEDVFRTVRQFATPIYVLFFVLVGARLDVGLLAQGSIALLAGIYVFARTAGKMSGASLGGIIGGAPPSVIRYLGLCLFSQAGVAIGLAFSIYNNLSHLGPQAEEIGLLVVNVIVATTFIVQLIGPVCVRLAVSWAGEVGRDVTEDDIIDSYRTSDVIEADVPVIREDTPLNSMVDLVKDSESHDFCVVDQGGRLLGTISIGDLRDILLERELDLNRLVLARDIAVPPARVIAAGRPLREALDILRRRDLDFLPVVKDESSRELMGLVHYRQVMSAIQKELLVRRGDS